MAGQDYGFSKPYSDDRAKMIDEEVSRIISEQYERAKAILREHAEGHAKLAETLITREVIFTEDVENIFGKRPWTSRTEEILAINENSPKKSETQSKEDKNKDKDIEDVTPIETPPPFKGLPAPTPQEEAEPNEQSEQPKDKND